MISICYNYPNAPSFWLDEFLDKKILVIEDILNEDITSEIKSNQQKFGKILLKYPCFSKKLIDYLIIEPSPCEINSPASFKFPFVASEIFACENKTLIDSFFLEIKYEEEHDKSKVDMENSYDLSSENVLKGLNDDDPIRSKDVTVDQSSTKIIQEVEIIEKENQEELKNFEEENKDNKVEDNNIKKIKRAQIKLENLFVKENESNTNEYSEEMVSSETPKFEKKNEILTLLDYLFTFLDNEGILNPTSAGYVQKVLLAILNKRGIDLISYIFNSNKIIKNILKHIGNTSIYNFLLRILTLDFPSFEDKKLLFLVERKDIIKMIFFKLMENISIEEEENLSFILNDILIKHANINGGQELIKEISNIDYLNILISRMNFESLECNSYPISILSNLINYYLSKEQTLLEIDPNNTIENDEDEKQNAPINPDFASLCEILKKTLLDLIPKLKARNCEEIPTSFGLKIVPFGLGRLKILELILLALKIPSSYSFLILLKEQNIFSIILELLRIYEWNSFLHQIIEKIIFTSLETDELFLHESLFVENKLLYLIVDLMKNQEIELRLNKTVKKGYIAFLTRISNYIIKLSDTNEYIMDQINNCEVWNNYRELILEPININETRDLGGQNPKQIYKTEEQVDNSKAKTNLQKIYEKFSSFFLNRKNVKNSDSGSFDPKPMFNGDNNKGYLSGIILDSNNTHDDNLSNLKINEFENVNHDKTHQNKMNERANLILAALQKEQEDEEKVDEVYFNNNFWKQPNMFTEEEILRELISCKRKPSK